MYKLIKECEAQEAFKLSLEKDLFVRPTTWSKIEKKIGHNQVFFLKVVEILDDWIYKYRFERYKNGEPEPILYNAIIYPEDFSSQWEVFELSKEA